jgi:ABC-2 type transport system permease protein
MSRSHSLRELYLSRLREFYRQPARIFWVYVFPTVLAVCLGWAFQNRPPEAIQADVVHEPGQPDVYTPGRQNLELVSPDVVQYVGWTRVKAALKTHNATAASAGKPSVRFQENSLKKALDRLETGKTTLVIEPKGSSPLVYHFDPTRPEAVTARALIDDILQESQGRRNPLSTGEERVTKPGARYIDFLIPGLIGINVMGGGLWGIGFLLVNFRIGKLLKRFVATPMPRRDFLLALLGARMTFLIPDFAVLMLMGHYGFGMPVKGSLWLIVLIVAVGALAFAGIGLLVGSRAQTTETVSGLMNLVMLPMWIFSGVFFSSARFEGPVQYFVQALPLTQLLNALRAVISEGAGLMDRDVAVALLILALYAVSTFLVALKIFRWS